MIRRLLGQDERPRPVVPADVEVVNEGPHSAEVYHDAARHFLDVQISTMDMLDAKITQYLSAASLVLPITFGLLNLTAPQRRSLPFAANAALVASLVAYAGVLIFAALASIIRALEYRPDIATLKNNSEITSGIYLKQWVANEYEASIAENKGVLQRKARRVGAEALAFYFEGICLALAVIFAVLL